VDRRRRHEARDYEYGDNLPVYRGDISAIQHPFDLTDDQIEQVESELAEKLAKKRPPGFAPWPDET